MTYDRWGSSRVTVAFTSQMMRLIMFRTRHLCFRVIDVMVQSNIATNRQGILSQGQLHAQVTPAAH